jgi:hypothetical protein
MTYRLDPNYPHVGTAVISPLPNGSSLNYHAIRNDASQGDIGTYDGFQRFEKWRAMTEFFPYAGPGDISMAMGVKDFPLGTSDSVEMTVVFALAKTSSELGQTIDEVKALWSARSEVKIAPSSELTVYPNPFNSDLHIKLPNTCEATLTIFDALGRTILMKHFAGSECNLAGLDLPAGIYRIEVLCDGQRITRSAISH